MRMVSEHFLVGRKKKNISAKTKELQVHNVLFCDLLVPVNKCRL